MASSASILSSVNVRFSKSSVNVRFSNNSPSSKKPLRSGSAAFTVRAEASSNGGINPEIRKNEAKVVDNVLVAELSKPLTAYCRCWRSGTFPLCDGSHVKHNKETGDNVGPLLLNK